jgi:hypothetical protein
LKADEKMAVSRTAIFTSSASMPVTARSPRTRR